MLDKKNNKLLEYVLIIVFGLFALYQGYILFGSEVVNKFFFSTLDSSNSDSIRLGGNIIRDVFYWDYGLSGWQFMPRPAFFPNLLVQAVVVPWGLNPILSNLIYCIVMCLITFLVLFLLIYQVAGLGAIKRLSHNSDVNLDNYLSWQKILIFCLGFFNICLFIANKTPLLISIYSTYHLENLFNTILYFYVMIRFVQKPTKTAVVFVSLMIFLGLVSNRLFIVTALIPAWVTIFCLLVFYKEGSFKKLCLWIIWQGLVAFISLMVYLLPPFFKGNSYLFTQSKSNLTLSQRVIDLFTYYHSHLASIFMAFVLISLLGLLLCVLTNYKNRTSDNKLYNLYHWRFFIIASFLAGLLNLLLFVISHGPMSGLNRYLIISYFLAPAIFLFCLYKAFPKLITAIYFVIGVFCVYFASNQIINYKIYAQKNPNDGSENYKLAKCFSMYSNKGYIFKSGLANYGLSLTLTYRNNLGIYLSSFDKSRPSIGANGFNFNPFITNMLYNIHAPFSNKIRQYNFIVFTYHDYRYLPYKYIPRFENLYGKPIKTLPCGKNIKIAYYGTHKAQKHLNKILFEQLTCKNKLANEARESHYINVLRKISHKVPKFLSNKLGINSEAGQKEIASKIHHFYDCGPVNKYLSSHPVYKTQVDALLNSAA